MKQKIILLLVVLMLVPSITVAAQNISDMQRQQRDIQREAQEARGELTDTQHEMEALEAEIYAIDRELAEASSRLETIIDALEHTKVELEETEIALEQAQHERDEHFEKLKTRLRIMYIQGPVGYLEVVLQATSFNNFLARLDRMNRVARSDREVADRLRDAEEFVANQVEQTYRLMTSIEALQVLEAERVAEINKVLDQKYEFLVHLADDAEQYEALIRQLEQADANLTAQIQQAQREAEARARAAAAEAARQRAAAQAAAQQVRPMGGTMLWPVPGHYRVSSGYGDRARPIGRGREFHTGVDIPAPTGTNILAAYGGVVILSGWNGGFGNTVVIDHGGGRTTLYGHNSRNLVTVGQTVARGDVIARVGSTGVSTGPHLHFEVRHNGNHVNPNPYLGLR